MEINSELVGQYFVENACVYVVYDADCCHVSRDICSIYITVYIIPILRAGISPRHQYRKKHGQSHPSIQQLNLSACTIYSKWCTFISLVFYAQLTYTLKVKWQRCMLGCILYYNQPSKSTVCTYCTSTYSIANYHSLAEVYESQVELLMFKLNHA